MGSQLVLVTTGCCPHLSMSIVAVVHFLTVELQFVLVRDGYVGLDEGALIIVKALAKCGEVLVSITFCVVGVFQRFLGFDIEREPAAVKMVEDWKGEMLRYAVRRFLSCE